MTCFFRLKNKAAFIIPSLTLSCASVFHMKIQYNIIYKMKTDSNVFKFIQKKYLLYLFTSWNRLVNDLRAESKFEYQIIPAQDLGKRFLTCLSGLSTLLVIFQKEFICKTHSAFTINKPSNKRPSKNCKSY